MCAKNHLLVLSSFLDSWENVEWPRFFGPPGTLLVLLARSKLSKVNALYKLLTYLCTVMTWKGAAVKPRVTRSE